jgi:hypothetical protein
MGAAARSDGRTEDGQVAEAASKVALTPSGLEQYDVLARSIADQIIDRSHRASLIDCKPATSKAPDDGCFSRFRLRIGRLLFRRPLTDEDDGGLAHPGARRLNRFYGEFGLSLAGPLDDPNLLFRIETVKA